MNFKRKLLRVFFILILCAAWVSTAGFLFSCDAEKAEKKAVLEIQGREFAVEIADTQKEREKGLMHRKQIPQYGGMIFVFEKDKKLSFWMKNTSIPLSIAYISSDWEIKEIHDMAPNSTSTVKSEHSVRYALEVRQGMFEKIGAKAGDTIKVIEGKDKL